MDAFISHFISWFNIDVFFLMVVIIIALCLIERTGRKYDAALEHIKELEEHLGVPLREEDLVPGEQYLRIDVPEETIFFKRVGTTVSNPMIRSVTFNSPIDAMIPEGTVFSVIQTEDGKRVLFNRRRELSPATIKTG